MRVTDDRYTQERKQLELAMRLLRYEARSATIRLCTGISEDRIRKLYKAYLEGRTALPLRRKRGKSPHEPSIFLRNAQAHLEASLLAGILFSIKLVDPAVIRADWRPSASFAERCCDAFDYYQHLVDRHLVGNPLPGGTVAGASQFTFEHAWFLMRLLSGGDELKMSRCGGCLAPVLQDRCATQPRPCPFCGGRANRPALRKLPSS